MMMRHIQDLELITYGRKRFDPSLFTPISNQSFVKPRGGLWASPIASEWGWKDWCLREGFRIGALAEHFTFTYSGGIIVIDSLNDLARLPFLKDRVWYWQLPDFETMLNDMGAGAIWLTARGERETRFSTPSLYGWDCESVLVMNKDGINAQSV